jgi:uncharacterized protein YndB with AHSA1/START domain/DNA-binding transcriptional ArsR family regulator
MPTASEQLHLDYVMTALADPTRRAILHRLAKGEARVTDLAQPFDMSLNAVSKHIRLLERARLIQRKRSGREHILSFNLEPLDQATDWIETQRAAWSTRLQSLDELLQVEDKIRRYQEEETIMDTSSYISVRVVHRFKASAERVFDGLLDPENVRVWMVAPVDPSLVKIVTIDARVGGGFSIVMPIDGVDYEHTGEYLEIDRPHRLVFTWAAEDSPNHDRILIDIVTLESGCELTLTHEIHPDMARCADQVEAGWPVKLEAMAAAL